MKKGLYRHSKSRRMYRVIGVANHSESLEELVVYEAQYESAEFGDKALWVRPKKMFCEEVVIDDKHVPRFKYIGE